MNYDRLPVGSIHTMANAVWSEGESSETMVVFKLARQQLVDMYLRNQAWINAYDHSLEDQSEGKELEYDKIEQALAGKCANGILSDLLPSNLAWGHWISHEIILGGKAAREAIFKKGIVTPIVDGCGKP
jgi:hypothetical protein